MGGASCTSCKALVPPQNLQQVVAHISLSGFNVRGQLVSCKQDQPGLLIAAGQNLERSLRTSQNATESLISDDQRVSNAPQLAIQ